MHPEVVRIVREEINRIDRSIREADTLSEPCPDGHWRWADVTLDGYGHKSDAELAADREYHGRRAVELRQRRDILARELAAADA